MKRGDPFFFSALLLIFAIGQGEGLISARAADGEGAAAEVKAEQKTEFKVDAPIEKKSEAAQPPVTPSEGAAVPTENGETGDYEIDYEEEPDAGALNEAAESGDDGGDADEAPTKKKHQKNSKTKNASSSGNAGASTSGAQGTHSKNRFGPMLKSDTKSIYKKNGHALDVDTD